MKRLLAVLAGGLGIGALLRRRRRRAEPPAPPPAEVLREKLAESRAAETETVTAPEEGDLDARRRDVHERARQSLDDLGRG